MNASNKICQELVCVYNEFSDLNQNTFTGYKLVSKKNLNYYSIVTGLFRYRSKNVSENSYHELHRRDNKYFNEKLINRVSAFINEEDAYNALISYIDIDTHKCELVMVELTLSGYLEKAYATNKNCKGEVVVGNTIEKVKEIKSYKCLRED
jgi:hypothetical protein